MDTTADPARAMKTSGEILFALCLALALSVYLLNSSLADRRDLLTKQWERHEVYSEMIERLRSFRAKDPALFEKLALSSLTIAHMISEDETRYPGLMRSVPTGPHSKAFLDLPEQRLGDLREAAQAFGKNAGQAFSAHPSQDDRVREFRTLVTDAFKEDADNDIVPSGAASSIRRLLIHDS
jgi:hypothetical protein